MFRNTRLIPYHRKEILHLYTKENLAVTQFTLRFNAISHTIHYIQST